MGCLPTQIQADINAAFPLTWPDWDFNIAEGKERLQDYCQVLIMKSGFRDITTGLWNLTGKDFILWSWQCLLLLKKKKQDQDMDIPLPR